MERGFGREGIGTALEVAFQQLEMNQGFPNESNMQTALFHVPDLSFFEVDRKG